MASAPNVARPGRRRCAQRRGREGERGVAAWRAVGETVAGGHGFSSWRCRGGAGSNGRVRFTDVLFPSAPPATSDDRLGAPAQHGDALAAPPTPAKKKHDRPPTVSPSCSPRADSSLGPRGPRRWRASPTPRDARRSARSPSPTARSSSAPRPFKGSALPRPKQGASRWTMRAPTSRGRCLPRLGTLKVVVIPAGVLWSEAPIGFAAEIWAEMPPEREAAARRFLEIAEQTLARSEAVAASIPPCRGPAGRGPLHPREDLQEPPRGDTDVSGAPRAGEIVGLLGPNGAGKTNVVLHDHRVDPARRGASCWTTARSPRSRCTGGHGRGSATRPGAVRLPQAQRRGQTCWPSSRRCPSALTSGSSGWSGCSTQLAIKHLRRQQAYQLSAASGARLEI